jgi:hypothetical protein
MAKFHGSDETIRSWLDPVIRRSLVVFLNIFTEQNETIPNISE